MANFPFQEILLLILGTLSTFLIWRVQYQKDRLRSIENQLSDKKYKTYSDLLNLFFDIVKSNKTGDKISSIEIANRMYAIKAGIFLYAPDEIFKKYTLWITSLNDNPGHFKIFYEILLLARKDMGNTKTQISLDEFMLFWMQNTEEYATFKKTYGW
ncbi:MAG: hypothetical protein ACKVU0_10310 [Saprospiraceae bacterium]